MWIIIVGLVEAAVAIGIIFMMVRKLALSSTGGALTVLEEREQLVTSLRARLEELYGSLIELPALADKSKELKVGQEALKAERGRITITQAELETIETRLRELEEIERELEASGIETKEELNILDKKEKELSSRNDALKQQIAASVEQLEQLLGQIEVSAQVQDQIQNMKAELIQTEQKITDLLTEIEQGNEQYFILKQRYDALDIEYAQLYEKFSEAEAMMGGDKSKEKD